MRTICALLLALSLSACKDDSPTKPVDLSPLVEKQLSEQKPVEQRKVNSGTTIPKTPVTPAQEPSTGLLDTILGSSPTPDKDWDKKVFTSE